MSLNRFFNGRSFRTGLQQITSNITGLNRFFNGRSFRTKKCDGWWLAIVSQPFFQRQVLSDYDFLLVRETDVVSTVFSTAGPFGQLDNRKKFIKGVSTVFSTAGPFGQDWLLVLRLWRGLNRFFNGRSFRTIVI